MIREEQIKQRAEAYEWTGDQFDIKQAFIEGTKWADKHPKEGMVSLDKVCEWIKNIDDFSEYIGVIFSGPCSIKFYSDSFVKNLRKAMEG